MTKRKRKPVRMAWFIYQQAKLLHKMAVHFGYDDYVTQELVIAARQTAQQMQCDVMRKRK